MMHNSCHAGAPSRTAVLRCLTLAVVVLTAVPGWALMEISPVLENVTDNCDGTYTAQFGYDNPNSESVTIPIGADNYFTGLPDMDQGQPSVFLTGRQTNVFAVTFDGQSVVWGLNGRTATATGGGASNQCGFSPISPVLEGVVDNCDGTYTAYFGYSNPNADSITVAVGDDNRFSGTIDRGQPTVFGPGRVDSVFSVVFDGVELVWTLTGKTATASAGDATTVCGQQPVSPVVESVLDLCDGRYDATFGYDNPNASAVSIPVGPDNILVGQENQPQTTFFEAGRHTNAFVYRFSGESVVWALDGHTATASPDQAPNNCLGLAVSPVLEGVTDNCDGTYTASFGYHNGNGVVVSISIGDENHFTGTSGQDVGQPTEFVVGRHTAAFSVTFGGGEIVWTLRGRTATATAGAAGNTCGELELSPVVESVVDNCDGTYTAHFGYSNPNPTVVTVPIGPLNSMVGVELQPQPTVFQPGRVVDDFQLVFDGSPVVWSLTGHTATASSGGVVVPCQCPEPVIEEHPSSVSAPVGGTARFTVVTGIANLHYQWRRNDIDLADATDSVLIVGPVGAHNASDEYRVRVGNGCGRTVWSALAVLTVEGSLRCAITQQPRGDTVEAGSPFLAEVEAACEGVSYQWYRDSLPVPSANERVLVTGPLTLDDDGARYWCAVTNGTVTDTSEDATVTVVAPRNANRLLAISGRLAVGSGDPVGSDGPAMVDLVVRLFTQSIHGRCLYTERFGGAAGGVVVDSGAFTVELGRGRAEEDLQEVVASHPNLYAEVSVAGEAEEVVGPRIPLTAAPYALSAAAGVVYGEGNPNDMEVHAPIGALYVDTVGGNATWRKASAGWVKLD